MAFNKINETDYANKGVRRLPVIPAMESAELQRVFDELCLDVLIPKINSLIDALEGITACADIGVEVPEGLEVSSKKLQDVINALNVSLGEKVEKEDGKGLSKNDYSDNEKKSVSDAKKIVEMLKSITGVSDAVVDNADLLVTAKAVYDYIVKTGSGDMTKLVYDKDGDGVVDNAAKLGGKPPSVYALAANVPTIELDEENQIAYITTNQV